MLDTLLLCYPDFQEPNACCFHPILHACHVSVFKQNSLLCPCFNESRSSSFGLCLLRLEGLLSVTLDHDEGEEASDNSSTNEDQDDRDANGPDTWREERLRGVHRINKWLSLVVRIDSQICHC